MKMCRGLETAMIKAFSFSVLLLCTILLAGCASGVPYRPIGSQSFGSALGYESSRISASTFSVTFRDTGSIEEISDLAMLRAAEVTQQHGYSYFSVIKKEDVSDYHEEKGFVTIAVADVNSDSGLTDTYQDMTTIEGSGGIRLTIQGYKGPPGKLAGQAYRASTMISDLKAKYKVKR